MNKTQYRIIFNAARCCMMAVAETAQAQGKSASGQTRGERRAPRPSLNTRIVPVQLACWLVAGVMGWSLPLMHSAQAQTTAVSVATRIVADPNAPKTQQATILRSGNGVIQVNIQTPSAAGVSRNTYTQFDVGNGAGGGAILNNSRTNVQSQQGGWVQANPWLATGTAKVILNEVNSSNPSQLKGFVEVAGQRAEVIVANPAGISVDGAGFINASRVTLTTGTPIMSGGSLDSYRVQGGTVRIDGQGLDTRDADYTAILTRALQVNAGVWANELHVVTGANSIQAASVAPGSTPQTSATAATTAAPAVALDVAQLGGMYAGKIHLIGTEAGLGVRNAGQIQAGSGPLTLSHEGWLSNSGNIQATQDLSVATQGRIDNSGSIYAAGQLNVSTPAAIVQTGTGAIMAAQSHATFSAATLSTAKGSAIGSGIQPNGQLANSGDLTLNISNGLQLQGQTLAGGLFKLSASSVDLASAQITAGQLDIRATSGNITTEGATISAINPDGQLKLSTTDTAQINNTRGSISGAQVQVSTGQFNNTQGIIAAQNLSIDTHQSALTNTSGTLMASQAVLLETGALGNQAGLIQSGTQLRIDTHGQTLNNSQAGQYPGNAKGEGKGQGGLFAQGQLNVNTGQLNNDAGYIASKGALTIDSTRTANTSQGQILSLGDIRVQTSATLDNTQGLIRSAAKTELNAQEIKNQDTLSSTHPDQTGIEGQTISIAAAKLQNDKGAIRAGQDMVVLSNGQINNNAGLISAGQTLSLQDPVALTKSATQPNTAPPTLAITNKDGVLIADSALGIDSQSLGGDGQILSKGALKLQLASDFNNSGKVIANGNATLVAANITNSGNLQAGQTLQLRAADIRNTATAQITGRTTQLAATGTLTNRGLIDGQDTLIDAATVNNIGTGRIYGDRLSIGATTLLNDSETLNGSKASAVIAARERLDIGAKTLTNREGALIFSAGDMAIGGQLDAKRRATGQAETVNNNSATIEALGNLSLSAATLNNTNEHFASELRAYGTPEDRFYIQPQGNSQKYLPTTFNKNDNGQLITYTWAATSTATPELGKTPMPTPGQLICSGEGDAEVCEVASGSEYAPSNPAWAYFKIAAPAVEPTQPTLANPVAPNLKVPQDPASTDICKVGSATYSASACNTAKAQYSTDKTAYDNAWSSYNTSKSEYDTAWAKYNKDHTQWEADITVAYDLLSDAITKYNAGFQSGTFANWTQYQLVRSYEKSVITQSDPGKILSGGSMSLTGQNLLNDKSQILAGGKLSGDLENITNKEGEGQFLTHEDGTAQYHGTRRGWYKLRRVTRNSWGSETPYHDTQTQTIALPVVKNLDNTTVNGSGTALNAAGVASVKANTSGPAQANARNATNVQAASANTKLPTSSLYKTHPESTSQYLVETDPQYAGYKTWLGSDYMLQSLHLNPGDTQKRLGDGFYEQKLIREQVALLTGQRFLGDYASDEEQYMALMTNGLTTAKALQLRPGVALSAEQMAQLTSDIVWLVEQTVTLADGSTQKVLTPQVYVRVKEGDLDGTGALIGGKDVNLKLAGDLTNSGTIAGRNVMEINANNINNLGGRLSADSLSAKASQDINNIGGTFEAQSKLDVNAGRDLNVVTTTQTTTTNTGANTLSNTGIDRVAGLYVKGSTGTLVASAGRDLNLTAAAVSNAGTGETKLSAGKDLNLGTVTTGSSQSLNWDANNHLRQSNSQDVGSQINAAGHLSLTAGNDLNAKAAQVSAGQELKATAAGKVNIGAGEASETFDEARKSTNKGVLSSTTTTTQIKSASTTALGSSFEGNSVAITAGQDLSVKGSNVLADQNVQLTAGGNVNIEAAQNTASQSSFNQTTTSGLMSGGGIGFTVGSRMQSVDQQGQSTTAAGSTVGSTGGNVTINAGKTYTQTGSDVLTPKGDIDISAKTVNITEARETSSQSSEQKFKQSGVSVGLTGGMIDTLQATTQALQGVAGNGSDRSKTLNALIAYGKASDLYEQGKATVSAADKNGILGGTGADGKAAPGAAAASGIKVSISAGSYSSQSNTNSTYDTSAGSTIKAGGSVNIKATEGDLTVQGSNVQADKDLALNAAKNVNILASADTEENRSNNKSSSTSVGVSFGVGAGSAGLSVDVAATKGKGQANSDSTTYNNSHIEAGNQVKITSGADTNIVGGNVTANQVTTNVGGNLNIQSLQDTATSAASQSTTGVAVSIPIGAGTGSASISQSKQRSDSNYQSVGEQSGIQAGAGGFQVNVKDNTDLQGAAIASTASADKNSLNTGTLTTSDISNSMSASASTSSTSVGTNMLSGKYELGKAVVGNALNNGGANQSDASTTKTAISAAQVTVSGKTTDTSKEGLIDSNGQTVGTDTNATNRTLAKADVAALQQQVQEKQASNMLLVNAFTVVGDKIYRKETEQKRLDRISCETANKENCKRQENVTLEQVKAVNGKITAINNGMLNTEDQAAIVAYMQSTGMQLQDGVLVVVNPKINDEISEAVWVAWKKVEQVFGFGTSSAGELNLALQTIAAAQDAKLDTNSHSAGNFAVDEMLRKVQESGTTNAAIGTVTMFGSPVNAQDTSDKVNAVTSGQGSTKQATHVNDFVGTLFGGNTPTGGNPNTGALPAHSSYTGELTTSNKDTPQLPGVDVLPPKEIKSATDNSWGFSRPIVVPPRSKQTNEGETK